MKWPLKEKNICNKRVNDHYIFKMTTRILRNLNAHKKIVNDHVRKKLDPFLEYDKSFTHKSDCIVCWVSIYTHNNNNINDYY